MASPSDATRLGRPTAGLLAGLAAVLLLATIVIGAVHVDDRYRVDTASGARVALARYFDEGTLYPPLYDGERYGGTRFMPLPLVMHGLAAKVTNEYLASGKVLSYLTTLGVLALVLLLLRRVRCPWPIALALAALVLATETGLNGTMSLRADSLSLLLQLAALAAVSGPRARGKDVASGLFAAIAFIAELSAIWAPLAITVHLLLVDRRRAIRFVTAWLGAAAALTGIIGIISDGRLFENVFGLAGAGVDGPTALAVAPYRLLRLMTEEALAAVILFPFAIAGVVRDVRDRTLSLPSVSLVTCTLVLLVVLTDIGTGWNQLIDLVVVEVLVVGWLAGRLQSAEVGLRNVLVGALLWAGAIGGATTVIPAGLDALATLRDPTLYDPHPVGRTTAAMLSEDPYVPVSVGSDPVVLDPFMLLRIGERDPQAVVDLRERIEAREFDLVLLTTELEPPQQEWWRNYHFGTEVTDALARTYALTGRSQGYFLYEPADPDGTEP